MKKINVFLVSGLALMAIVIFSAFANRGNVSEKMSCAAKTVVEEIQEQQTINMFVTHGHCSSPFSGQVENLEVSTKMRTDGGDPLENMQVSFLINPETFTTCRREYPEITSSVQTPGLFSDEEHQKITFKSTNVYTMGIDWYQINGKLSIKGVEKEVKFFASGIRDPKSSVADIRACARGTSWI
jgi:polyisoprenoid-binding protein YceI